MNDSFQGITDTNNYLMPGSGQPWCQQYYINETQSGDISNWMLDKPLPFKLISSNIIVTKNRAYILAACLDGLFTTNVYTAIINPDGTLGEWVADNPLPEELALTQVVTIKNRVYLLGGYLGVYNDNYNTKTIYTTTINSDGRLGEWSVGGTLPVGISSSQAIVTNNRIYLLGGTVLDRDGTSDDTAFSVYTTLINPDGTLGEWSRDNNHLPTGLVWSQVAVITNRIYLLGGRTNNGIASSIYTAIINDDGTLGNWTCVGSIPIAVGEFQVFVTKNTVYLIGGCDNNHLGLSNVYYANINIDGTLGEWTTGTPLPCGLYGSSLFATKNKIYLVGGFVDPNTTLSTVCSATISGGLNDYSPYYNE